MAKLQQKDYAIDGTEREIQRPVEEERQKFLYSGKTKMHSVKNLVITSVEDRLVKFLSDTYEGKRHDKKIADEEGYQFPEDTFAFVDSGFQGMTLEGAEVIIPKKKPRGAELSEHDKEINTLDIIGIHTFDSENRGFPGALGPLPSPPPPGAGVSSSADRPKSSPSGGGSGRGCWPGGQEISDNVFSLPAFVLLLRM